MNAIFAVLATLAAAAGPPGRFAEEVQVGDAISVGNLSVFPLRLRRAVPAPDALALDEAMRAGLVTVREAGGGMVNRLLVSNRGDRPVYAMAGELLIGGKQDRIIGQALVLPPHAAEVPVPVFCVEHGRWQGASATFRSAGVLGHSGLRQKALAGQQVEVWREVAAANARLHTENASDTYRAAAGRLARDVGPAAARVLGALDGVPEVAGLAAAIDGRVVAVELFASPRLFARARQKLVASYVAEALAAPPSAHPAAPPSRSAVAALADEAERGEALAGKAVDPTTGRALQTSYLAR